MKRLLQIGLLAICLVCALGFAVYAAPEDRGYTPLEQTIYNGMIAHEEAIDLSMHMPTEAAVRAAYQHVYYTSAELFYVAIGETYRITKNAAGQVIYLKPTYNSMTTAEIAEASTLVEETIDRIVAGVKSTWSDMEKALYVHDYIALYYDYDQGLTIRDAYTFFTEGEGVCVAYAITYCAAMEEIGIPVDVVTSVEQEHIWNVVQVDGNWYHVDVTFDDPIALDEIGCVSHAYFLKSTAIFLSDAQHAATDWEMYVTCGSTAYDSAFWNKVESPFCYVGDTWYCIYGVEDYRNTAIYAYDFSTGASTAVQLLNSYWRVGSSQRYTGSFAKLGMYKDKLYYTTPSAIMMYDPATDTASTVYQLVGTQIGSIYNFMVRDNIAYYVTNTQNTDGEHPIRGSYKRTLVNRYSVQFLASEGGEVLFTALVDEGSTVPLPDYTQKVEDHKVYPFAGWQGYTEGMTVTENISLVALYDTENAVDLLYTYTFYGEDGTTILLQGEAIYGTPITPPVAPTKEADSLWQYTFAGWQGYTDGMTVTGNMDFTATFTRQAIATTPPAASTPQESQPAASSSAISGSEPGTNSSAPATGATAGDPTALLGSPVIWLALGVVAFAVLVPTLLIATEREKKTTSKKEDTRGNW